MTDLTFIEDGNPDFVEVQGAKLINFVKCRQLSRVIQEIRQYQQKNYNFQPVEILQEYFNSMKPMSSDDLYKLSHELEPSANQQL